VAAATYGGQPSAQFFFFVETLYKTQNWKLYQTSPKSSRERNSQLSHHHFPYLVKYILSKRNSIKICGYRLSSFSPLLLYSFHIMFDMN
jgi:hypothetical protein